jgi:hypothetical protein
VPTIPVPTPSTGLLVRRPSCVVYVDGRRLPFVLELSTTRGLDQEVGTCDVTYPHPLPDWVRIWSEVRVLVAGDRDEPLVERFVGFVLGVGASLWPGAHTIHCEDRLSIAKYTYTPEEMSFAGDTDVQAILRILRPPDADNAGGCGIGVTTADILGLNRQLTDYDDVTLIWDVGQTALEVIQQIDSASLGYRTYCTAGGRIRRTKIATDPNTVSALWHFQEGVDILDGSDSVEIKDAKNEITISGFDETVRKSLPADEDPFYWRRNSYWLRFLWLKTHAAELGILNPTEVAEYILSQINKNIIKVTFSTHLATLFNGMEVVKVTSPRLEVDNHFWVQSAQLSFGADGAITQTITGVSELIDNVNRGVIPPPVVTPIAVPPGVPVAIRPIAPTPIPPSAADIMVEFSLLSVDKEFGALPSDPDATGTTYYTIAVADHSSSRQGAIVSRAWSASGPGVRIAAGTEPTFTTAFTSLEGATITLSVTDEHGSTGSLTLPAYDETTPIRTRTLYACTPTSYEAFDGDEWRSAAPGAGGVTVVAAGPVWGGTGGRVAVSNDDLATPPTETIAPVGDISAIWLHESDSRYIVVGDGAGQLAVSKDRGATWTPRTGPGGAINFVISSIFNPSEWHVVTPSGWHTSTNEGATWSLVRAGSFVYLELAPGRNITVGTDGVLRQGETGTPFTGNTSPIVAATAHIRADRFYAIAEDGTTWVVTEPGSFTLVAGAVIPAGEPYAAGAYRDPQVVDLVYFAAQAGGLFKTLDGFRTPDGYLRLRTVGRLTP